MRDYSRPTPQDTTRGSAPSFEYQASGSTVIANPESNSTTGLSPAFEYPFSQPSNLGQMMHPVSSQRLMVYQGVGLPCRVTGHVLALADADANTL
jgi:hypothetical protein